VSVFGTIVLPTDVEQAITALLKEWMDTYLREMERKTDRENTLPSIRAWGLGEVEDRLSGQEPPFLTVECGKITRLGKADAYGGVCDVTLATITRSEKSLDRVRELSHLYTIAASLILIQQQLPVSEVLWVDDEYGILSDETRRYLARGEAHFTVNIPVMAQIDAGPTEVAPDQNSPPREYPVVETVDLDVDLE
jgi:hypothetical protein